MALNDKLQTATASLEDLLATFASEKRALEEEKAQWANMEPKLDTSNLADPITLNVGGIPFALILKDLTSKPGSYFSAMFSGRCDAKVDKNGAFFINRSPAVFEYIAEHLRGRELKAKFLTPKEKDLLMEEAEFYRLDGLMEELNLKHTDCHIIGELEFMTNITPQHFTFSDNNRTATKTSCGGFNATVVGSEMAWPDTGYSEVRIKHTFLSPGGILLNHTMIGLAPSQAIVTEAASGSAPFMTCGWYLHTNDGTLYSRDAVSDGARVYNTSAVPNGATVGIRLHSDGKVSFTVNGNDRGTAFTISTGQQCRVAVMPYHVGTIVELLL